MAKMKASYRVDEKNKAVILNKDVPLTKNEELYVNSLKDKGYILTFKSVAKAKVKAKDETLKRGKAYFEALLSKDEYKEFDKMCHDKKIGFFNARKWANDLITNKAKAEAEKAKAKTETAKK